MEAVAKLNNCPTSTRKMRLVVDAIRGKDVLEAMNVLKYSRKEAATKVDKLLRSAISNWAAKNEGFSVEDSELYVKQAFVDGGRMLKRLRPAPFGRAFRVRKRSNHVTIIIDSRVEINNEEPAAEAEAETEA